VHLAELDPLGPHAPPNGRRRGAPGFGDLLQDQLWAREELGDRTEIENPAAADDAAPTRPVRRGDDLQLLVIAEESAARRPNTTAWTSIGPRRATHSSSTASPGLT
jgi:hypothetical protein